MLKAREKVRRWEALGGRGGLVDTSGGVHNCATGPSQSSPDLRSGARSESSGFLFQATARPVWRSRVGRDRGNREDKLGDQGGSIEQRPLGGLVGPMAMWPGPVLACCRISLLRGRHTISQLTCIYRANVRYVRTCHRSSFSHVFQSSKAPVDTAPGIRTPFPSPLIYTANQISDAHYQTSVQPTEHPSGPQTRMLRPSPIHRACGSPSFAPNEITSAVVTTRRSVSPSCRRPFAMPLPCYSGRLCHG